MERLQREDAQMESDMRGKGSGFRQGWEWRSIEWKGILGLKTEQNSE